MLSGHRFNWQATYNDGSRVFQRDPTSNTPIVKGYDESGQPLYYGYEDLDRDRLATFEIWEGSTRYLLVKIGPGQHLIWRRRVEVDNDGNILEICHIIAKKERVGDKVYQGVLGLFESDGRVEPLGNWREGHPWAYPPNIAKGF